MKHTLHAHLRVTPNSLFQMLFKVTHGGKFPSRSFKRSSDGSMPLVLGGGAMLGAALPGFLDYLEQQKVAIGDVYGISIGAIVGQFYANGYSPRAISKVFSDEARLRDGLPLSVVLRSFMPPLKPRRHVLPALIDLVPVMTYLADKYKLSSQPDCHLLAMRVSTGRLVDLSDPEFDNVPVGVKLAACGAVPFLFRPVEINGHAYVDGGVYHAHPGDVVEGPTLVAKLFHGKAIDAIFPDGANQITVEAGDPFMLPFKLMSERECERLYWVGYRRAANALGMHIHNGVIPTIDDSIKTVA